MGPLMGFSIKRYLMALSLLLSGVVVTPQVHAAQDGAGSVTGEDVVKNCDFKNPGNDQRSKLAIILKDSSGSERKNVYLRLWKDYKGAEGVADKMILFTEYPPDAQGAAFMRWAFTRESDKNADQWIYLPALRKIRRVSIRDPGDSFLGSDLTYADISGRAWDEDEHKLIRIETANNNDFYVVESTPKEKSPLYSKRLSWFLKTPTWDGCIKARVDYYDKRGDLLKRQNLRWQKVGPAWVWDKVVVQNVQTLHSSLFEVTNVEINVGLQDSLFAERTLEKGYSK
ncbi:MAG: outer membrane lipoprotein-sorting protein [Gammaproteobacteria bacterium]